MVRSQTGSSFDSLATVLRFSTNFNLRVGVEQAAHCRSDRCAVREASIHVSPLYPAMGAPFARNSITCTLARTSQRIRFNSVWHRTKELLRECYFYPFALWWRFPTQFLIDSRELRSSAQQTGHFLWIT